MHNGWRGAISLVTYRKILLNFQLISAQESLQVLKALPLRGVFNTFQEHIHPQSSVRVWESRISIYHTLPRCFSNIADILQPDAAVIFRQGEPDMLALLPAATDPSELLGHAGQSESQAAQQNHEGNNQDQNEGGRQVEVVLGWIKGAVPAVEEHVEGGHGQRAVT